MQNGTDKKMWLYQAAGWLFLAMTLIIIYIGNRATPFMMDDEWYATKLFSEEPVQSLRDVWEAQVWHFHHWGGRSIAHGLLQLALMSGVFWADVINVVFGALLGIVICKTTGLKMSRGNKIAGRELSGAKKQPSGAAWYLAMILGMLFGLNANWSQSLCWHSGAANYLYMTTFILVYLWCFVRMLEGENRSLPGISIWMWPLGLVAGWSNENMGPTVWILSLGIMGYLWKKERRWYWWMLWGNITCLIGTCLVILAPGNFVRSAETVTDKGLLWRIFLRCYAETKAFAEFLSPTLLVFAGVLCLYIGVCGCRLTKSQIVYMLGALLSWGAMILSPHYPDRATFGTMVLLICAIMSMAKVIVERQQKLAGWLLLAGGVIWLRGMFFLMEYACRIWGWV